jgi:hypothetical protein
MNSQGGWVIIIDLFICNLAAIYPQWGWPAVAFSVLVTLLLIGQEIEKLSAKLS